MEPYACNFCGKSQKEVKQLTVNGRKGVAICNECVDVIVDMRKKPPPLGLDRYGRVVDRSGKVLMYE